MHRLRIPLLGAVVLVSLAGCSSGTAGGSATPRTASSSTSSSVSSSLNHIGTPLNSVLPTRIRDLSFTASNGNRVSLADLRGRIVVLSDVMTLCQETCPIDTATVVQTARTEASKHSRKPPIFISLTVDPARDTTTQLKAYRHLFTDPPANWQAWTGSSRNVNAVWDYLGVWRKRVADDPGSTPHNWRTGAALTYDVQHSDEVFFFDPSGHERFVLEGTPYAKAGTVPKALRDFMNAEGRKNLRSPKSTAWTEAQAETVLRWLRRSS